MKKIIYLSMAAVFGLSACCSTKEATKNKSVGLQDTYWKLIELNGAPVSFSKDQKEVYVILHTKDNRAGGNGGCNGYGGNYELNPNGFNIKFSTFIRTMMACPELQLEDEYLKVFENADSYYVYGDTLQLNRARMAPLARFKAVKGKAETIK